MESGNGFHGFLLVFVIMQVKFEHNLLQYNNNNNKRIKKIKTNEKIKTLKKLNT